ncbi:hypothetical protein IKS57_05500 [bacterium]|nr:hypothetical protein [bacterium]
MNINKIYANKKEKIEPIKQPIITFDLLCKYFDLVHLDYLGNIGKIESIQELFDKL